MLTLMGGKLSYCDRVPRRSFLQVGFLGLGGLSLPEALQQRAVASETSPVARKTSVIFLELAGGPTQFETYDPKPDAPAEYRGPLDAVRTSVPGVLFCELMAQQAKVMDKLAVVRSVRHERNSHDPSSHLTQTGYYKSEPKGGANQSPCIGSITAKIRGANVAGLPPYVAIPDIMRNGAAAYLGKSYNPFETKGDVNRKKFKVKNLGLVKGCDIRRMNDRRALLSSLDAMRRSTDIHGVADSMDTFTHQAFDLVMGDRARRAFDIRRENPTDSRPLRTEYCGTKHAVGAPIGRMRDHIYDGACPRMGRSSADQKEDAREDARI